MAAQQQALSLRSARPYAAVGRSAVAWSLAVGFAALTAGLLAVGLGHIVQLLFPVAAVFVGAILYFQHPTLYLGFTWWLWFLTPEVRRLVDYQIGWNPISPVMIAPYLVAGVAGLTLLRCLPQMAQRPTFFPFALILMGLNYGYTIGIVRAGPLAATFGLLTWIVPVVFGFHVAARWQQYPLYRDALQRAFLWGVLVMGTYGIVQYFIMPPWDAYWAIASGMGSLNNWMKGGAFSVRVWSTMNSPQPFAIAMMAGLLLAFAAKGPFRLIAAAPGYVAFLLSLARTAWLGWAIGAVVLLVRVRGVQKMKLLVAGTLLAMFSLPLLLLEPVAEPIASRFASMQQLEEDGSYRSRLRIYAALTLRSMTSMVGEGIGSTNLATKLTNDGGTTVFGDAGILELPFTLGWPGSLLYLAGLVWLLSLAFTGRSHRKDIAAQAAGAVALATLAQMLSYNTLVSVMGMVFWSFLGLMLSARLFHRSGSSHAIC